MMNKQFMSKMLLAVVFVSAAFQNLVWAESTEADKRREAQANRENREEKGRRPDKKPPLADMSAEDKAAMKKALQAVWENPEVMQARDEVKRATETFHQAIRKAVGQEDPRVAALVERMHGSAKSRERNKKRPGPGGRPPKGRPPGAPGANERGPGPTGDGRGIGPAGFMAFSGEFSKEEKMRLEKARKKAMESEAYKNLQGDLRALLKQGEDLRKKRVEMFHKARLAMARAMVEVDPEVKPLLERIEKGRKER